MTIPKAHALNRGPWPLQSKDIFSSQVLRFTNTFEQSPCRLQAISSASAKAAEAFHSCNPGACPHTRPGDSQKDASSDVEATSEHSRHGQVALWLGTWAVPVVHRRSNRRRDTLLGHAGHPQSSTTVWMRCQTAFSRDSARGQSHRSSSRHRVAHAQKALVEGREGGRPHMNARKLEDCNAQPQQPAQQAQHALKLQTRPKNYAMGFPPFYEMSTGSPVWCRLMHPTLQCPNMCYWPK